jgi:hypothetical protein
MRWLSGFDQCDAVNADRRGTECEKFLRRLRGTNPVQIPENTKIMGHFNKLRKTCLWQTLFIFVF